jgi:hypothetical protein
MRSKINLLLENWPDGGIATLHWLRKQSVDRRLADKYVQSGWLRRLGHGAYQRPRAAVDWPGAVGALQSQLGLCVHPGAMTAFELRGYAHQLALGERAVTLVGAPGTRLPRWFKRHSWSRPVTFVTTRIFPSSEHATAPFRYAGTDLEVATPERAAFEMFYLVPRRLSYAAALQVMESLTTLRPRAVQHLLETCTSVKTKRLFMHGAERFHHPWLPHVDVARVDFGAGKRTIHPGGTLDRKYELVVAESTPE